MSVMILRARNLLSLSCAASCDYGAKLKLCAPAFERSTGSKKETTASCIWRMTLWLVDILSAIRRRVY